jgi:hypothetical protein
MLKFHQEETCKGIIQRLEAREGKTRRDVRERDKGSHMASSDARVEMTFWLGDQLYALEHTGIEPFDGTLWSFKTPPTDWSSPLEPRS